MLHNDQALIMLNLKKSIAKAPAKLSHLCDVERLGVCYLNP